MIDAKYWPSEAELDAEFERLSRKIEKAASIREAKRIFLANQRKNEKMWRKWAEGRYGLPLVPFGGTLGKRS
ncbi:MAG TPA: hypothetical protein VHM93_03380 [Candidatus Acidoferrum sp.]|nr:hypothetical protein [Candidatus Acidoferrum sp.]